MNKRNILTAFTFLLCITIHYGQHYSDNPLDAKFVTEDVDRFWEAFDQMEEKGVTAFEVYIENGTEGLKGFTDNRIINADSLYHKVLQRKEDYLASKYVLDDLDSKAKRIRAIYSSMKYWYPEAVFPPVYFVVGRFNSGGTVSESGIILGAEMQENLDGIPGLVAHELIHYQQGDDAEYNLLSHSISEGSADFIGELISGENINTGLYKYGDKNKEELCQEFAEIMYKTEINDWLYGTSGKDDRPNDLGYWMGYQITEAYFNKQTDKHKAIEAILNITDPYDFLYESGYLKEYTTLSKEMIDKKRPKVVSIDPFKNGSQNVDSTINKISVKFDNPIVAVGISINEGDKGENTFPDFGEVSYSADFTELNLEVKLKPDKEYQFIISGWAITSEDGYSMKDYLIDFKTK